MSWAGGLGGVGWSVLAVAGFAGREGCRANHDRQAAPPGLYSAGTSITIRRQTCSAALWQRHWRQVLWAGATGHCGPGDGDHVLPKELTTAYQKAFEAAHPGIKIEILNKNTTAAVAYIRELPEGQRPDVMWASAPTPSEVLASYQLLQKAPEVVNKARRKIGNYPLNDPRACTAARRWRATASRGTRATSRRTSWRRPGSGAT